MTAALATPPNGVSPSPKTPDFSKMKPEEILAYIDQERRIALAEADRLHKIELERATSDATAAAMVPPSSATIYGYIQDVRPIGKDPQNPFMWSIKVLGAGLTYEIAAKTRTESELKKIGQNVVAHCTFESFQGSLRLKLAHYES